MIYAPIVLFVYKRLDTVRNCVKSLQRNELSHESELFIFSDAAKSKFDQEKVNAVRFYIDKIVGFKKVTIIKAAENKGLAKSVITGVSEVIDKYGKVIVLEDDLLVSNNFLAFMNQSLDFYGLENRVFSISAFTLPVKPPFGYQYDIYYTKRIFSWGWATWKAKWECIDWEVSDYASFISDGKKQKDFNSMGSDLSSMLHKQMNGQISSWSIKCCYHQFKYQLYTVFPIHSKVINIGFNADATHSGQNVKRYQTIIEEEDQMIFRFSKEVGLNPQLINQFLYHFSIPIRIYYKIADAIDKLLR